jgi:hypothetical protein
MGSTERRANLLRLKSRDLGDKKLETVIELIPVAKTLSPHQVPVGCQRWVKGILTVNYINPINKL